MGRASMGLDPTFSHKYLPQGSINVTVRRVGHICKLHWYVAAVVAWSSQGECKGPCKLDTYVTVKETHQHLSWNGKRFRWRASPHYGICTESWSTPG
mmetsp:Transcript_19932/g.38281  ORF Transcript_19932/g.38281 Transcript_19932/m.38281 type:complete len:97 (+) Transcript_19932:659-949(+)